MRIGLIEMIEIEDRLMTWHAIALFGSLQLPVKATPAGRLVVDLLEAKTDVSEINSGTMLDKHKSA